MSPAAFHDLVRAGRALGTPRACEMLCATYEVVEDLGDFTIAGPAGERRVSGYTLDHCDSEYELSWSWPGGRARVLAWLRSLIWSCFPDPLPPPDAPASAWLEMESWEAHFPESYPDEGSSTYQDTKRVLAFRDDGTPLAVYESFEGMDRCGRCLEIRHRPRRIVLRADAGAVCFDRARSGCVSADPDPAAHACADAAWTMSLPDGRVAPVPDYAALIEALAGWG